QHNQQRTTESIADDRYEFRWDRAGAPVSGDVASESFTWILIGDDPEAVRPLIDVLAARGHRHRLIGLPVSDADEEQLVHELSSAADDPQLRIVNVAALESDATPSMRSLLRMQHRVLGGTRRLFRAATTAGLRRPIWVVTRGAQRVTDADTVSPDQSCMWGFGRAAALELPQVWGGLADLSGGTSGDVAAEWSGFVDRITTPDDSGHREDQIALRDQTVYVPRLVRRATQPSGTPLQLRDNATYLVTGGLGSIGL
ncbi:hypothetical protein C6A85_87350, partial [Mycobacterium sp. ITM-2017-0098]